LEKDGEDDIELEKCYLIANIITQSSRWNTKP